MNKFNEVIDLEGLLYLPVIYEVLLSCRRSVLCEPCEVHVKSIVCSSQMPSVSAHIGFLSSLPARSCLCPKKPQKSSADRVVLIEMWCEGALTWAYVWLHRVFLNPDRSLSPGSVSCQIEHAFGLWGLWQCRLKDHSQNHMFMNSVGVFNVRKRGVNSASMFPGFVYLYRLCLLFGLFFFRDPNQNASPMSSNKSCQNQTCPHQQPFHGATPNACVGFPLGWTPVTSTQKRRLKTTTDGAATQL